MNRIAWRLIRIAVWVLATWGIARIVFQFIPRQDEVGAMVLLMCVLAAATRADRVLAIAVSLSADLSFNYYYVGPAYTLSLMSVEDDVSFVAFMLVALTGSHLSIRAQLRAEESERRRSEMERLQKLGTALIATTTVNEAADRVVHEIVNLFGGGAVLYVEGVDVPFEAGSITSGVEPVEARTVNQKDLLKLYGPAPSAEVLSALVNLIGLVLDRAVAAEARARIEAAQRGDELRTTVLNALAHNFRTPLTCIKAAASMMRGSVGTPASYRQELLEVIDEEADRLDELIRDSLDLARIQARQKDPRVEACPVGSIVSSVLEKMKRYLARQTVVVTIPEDLPVVYGDRFLLEQMVTQVLDNAWKYSASGAFIRVSALSVDNEVVLTIQNEGAQIPEAERSLVFERFYRGADNHASIEGTGLGLAIAKTIAEASGGRLWLDAEPQGPAFRFALPAGVPAAAETEEDHDHEPDYIAD